MTDGLRVAVIGAGFIGTVHARSARLAGARLVGVAASSAQRGAQAADALGADRAFRTAEEAATAADVDVVHICTPNHLHVPLTLAALDAGKHVVCEKPVATTLADAQRLVTAAERANQIVAVPFVYRFHPVIRHARALIRDGEFGEIRLIHGTYLQDWLLRPEDTNWRVDAELGGASRAFADIGSHWCDLAEFVSGHRFTDVTGVTPTFVPDRATEDAAVLLLRTDRGAVANVVVSQVSAGRKNRLWLEIDGSTGSCAFDQEQPESLWIGRRDRVSLALRDPETLGPDAARHAVVPAGHPQGYLDCFDAFVRDAYAAIRDDERPLGLPDIRDGVRAVGITEAVRVAASSGSWAAIT